MIVPGWTLSRRPLSDSPRSTWQPAATSTNGPDSAACGVVAWLAGREQAPFGSPRAPLLLQAAASSIEVRATAAAALITYTNAGNHGEGSPIPPTPALPRKGGGSILSQGVLSPSTGEGLGGGGDLTNEGEA